jgi:hypothetical protein
MDYVPPMTRPGDGPTPQANEGRSRSSSSAAPSYPDFDALQDELAAALVDALGGFELLDRDLELPPAPGEPMRAADLVGVDGEGRGVFVLLLEPNEVEHALELALDFAYRAESERALVQRHLDRPLAAAPCAIVLVGEGLPETLRRRAAVVGSTRLCLLEVNELRSARGVTTWFSPTGARRIAPSLRTLAEHMAALPPAVAEVVTPLRERLVRLDPDLRHNPIRDGLEWQWKGHLLCRVTAREGTVEAIVDSRGEPQVGRLAPGPSLDTFVEAVLARFVELQSSGVAGHTPILREVSLTPARDRAAELRATES